jgi:hypothetical protein
MSAIADIAPAAAPKGEAEHRRVLRVAGRYGLSAFGPVSVSGAHFAASILFLHFLSRTEFGLFAFLFVIVPLCMSASISLLGASVASAVRDSQTLGEDVIGTHFKANLVLSALASFVVFALLATSGAPIALALPMSLYAAVMTSRCFARSYSYLTNTPVRAAAADLAYSALLLTGLGALAISHQLTAMHGADVLLAASLLSLGAFGLRYLARQVWPGRAGSLAAYIPIWRDLTRWSFAGVLLTEITANAHAYLVTLISGPASFALLALGSLMMRPASLVLTALPDMERPVMARALAAGKPADAFRSVKEFRTAAGAVWCGTILLAGALLLWFPHLILKRGYDETQVVVVIAIWAAIQAVRALRTPESVFLQAAREFRPLAKAGLWSSGASLAATLTLLMTFGPVASLAGILFGDLIMTQRIFAITKQWRLRHG